MKASPTREANQIEMCVSVILCDGMKVHICLDNG